MLDNGNAPHILDFGEPEKENSIIKVIGVGGAPSRRYDRGAETRRSRVLGIITRTLCTKGHLSHHIHGGCSDNAKFYI